MDKRYFLIIIIICVCCVNLYMIATVSDIVGSASTDIGDYTFTLPSGFSLYDNDGKQIFISNPTTKMNIRIYNSISKKDTYQYKCKELENNTQYKIFSNGTIERNGIKIQSIFYQKIDDSSNHSSFYFTKYDNNFKILTSNFNYDSQKNETITIVTDIIESFRINYKNL